MVMATLMAGTAPPPTSVADWNPWAVVAIFALSVLALAGALYAARSEPRAGSARRATRRPNPTGAISPAAHERARRASAPTSCTPSAPEPVDLTKPPTL